MLKKHSQIPALFLLFLTVVGVGIFLPGNFSLAQAAPKDPPSAETQDDDNVPTLIKQLKSRNSAKRRNAMAGLNIQCDERATDALITALNDKDTTVRIWAGLLLGDLKDPKGVDPLIEAMKDRHWGVRLVVVMSMQKIGSKRFLDSLIIATKDENILVRQRAVETLGGMGDSKGTDAILHVLKNEKSRVIRHVAIEALCKMQLKKPVPLFSKILKLDRDPAVRSAAARVLGKIGDKQSITALLAALRREGRRDPKNNIQLLLISLIANTDDKRVVKALGAVMDKSKDSKIRLAAISKLGKIGGNRVARKLLNTLRKKGSDYNIQLGCANALGKCADESTLKKLTVSLLTNLPKKPPVDVNKRSDLIAALGTQVSPYVIKGLKYKDPKAKMIAVMALGKIGDEAAMKPLLIVGLKGKNRKLQATARTAAAQIEARVARANKK